MEIKFELSGPYRTASDATPGTGEEVVQYHRAPPPFQCFGCGRFAKLVSAYQRYNGTWNIHYADVSCSRCGEYTEALT